MVVYLDLVILSTVLVNTLMIMGIECILNGNNGEYELITPYGQARYTQKRKYKNYVGYRSFDKQEFENLISQYINKQ